jgi:NAD(P)H dehydrogenase (quinone)
MGKIAVTAASGRLGRATLLAISDLTGPDSVVGVARSPAKINVPGIETRGGDYQSSDELVRAFRDIDTVVMISAPVGPWDRIVMHRNVINSAAQAGVRKLLYTSVIGSEQERDTWFWSAQAINRRTETDVRNSGLQWVIARNGLYLELDVAHILRTPETGIYQNNGGDGRCGYVTIDELAFAIANLAIDDKHNGRIYNLVGESKTQAELCELVNQVFGLHIEYQEVSDEDNVRRLMADPQVAARGEEVARMLTGCYQCIRTGAFNVASDYPRAAGRPAKTALQMMEEYRQHLES